MSIVAYNSGGEPPEMTTIRSPASAGYCRLRTLGSSPVVDPGMRDVANDDPSVISIGSPSSANLTPSLLEAYFETDRPAGLISSIKREAIPSRSTCASSPRIRSGTRWPGSASGRFRGTVSAAPSRRIPLRVSPTASESTAVIVCNRVDR